MAIFEDDNTYTVLSLTFLVNKLRHMYVSLMEGSLVYEDRGWATNDGHFLMITKSTACCLKQRPMLWPIQMDTLGKAECIPTYATFPEFYRRAC